MKPPSISAIICTYNRASLLKACLDSLVNQTLDSSLYEVIVVDNNSTDDTLDMVSRFVKTHPNVILLSESSQGASQARNRGWRKARGKYVAFIDDDAKATPDWLERIVDAFESVNPKPIVVGGEIYPYYDQKMPAWFTDDLEIRTWGDKKDFLTTSAAQFGFSESNISFQTNVIDTYGGFSSEFGKVGSNYLMGEGAYLCQKIYKTNPYFWYDPLIRVYHYTSRRNANIIWRLKRAYKIGASQTKLALNENEEMKHIAKLTEQYGVLKVFFWYAHFGQTLREYFKMCFYSITFQREKKFLSTRSFFKYAKQNANLYGKIKTLKGTR